MIGPRYTIDFVSGNCPVQAEGGIYGFRWYFRARGRSWYVEVYDGSTPAGWCFEQEYSGEDKPYAAGWMEEAEARHFIDLALNQWLVERLSHPAPTPIPEPAPCPFCTDGIPMGVNGRDHVWVNADGQSDRAKCLSTPEPTA